MINQDNKNDLGDKKRNNELDPNIEQEKNEGFSGRNISSDYNPAPLKTEWDIDLKGNHEKVERARNANANPDNEEPSEQEGDEDINRNYPIEEPKRVENRDLNYDDDPKRYPGSDNENQKNQEDRGNIKLDE